MSVRNMYTNRAEQHYFDLYFSSIQKHLTANSNILDIGCQNGRFTIPLANSGHRLTATDIENEYFDFIKSNLNDGVQVNFRKEEMKKTISRETANNFDNILCLELLYTMKNTPELLKGLAKLLKSNGLLITSHRTVGYYIYRYLKEKNFKALDQILHGKHLAFNCHTSEQLIEMYSEAGYTIEELKPIGMFSGFSKDPFSFVADPEELDDRNLKNIETLENNPVYQSLFANNARYLLVIAKV